MFNINGNIGDLLKLPLNIILGLCVGSGLILFLPNNIIEKISMLDFINTYGFILGLTFIISLSIIVCTIIIAISKVVIEKIKNKKDIEVRYINKHLEKFNEKTNVFWKSVEKFENNRKQNDKDNMIKSLEEMLKEFEDVGQEIRVKCQFQECLELFKEFYIDLGKRI